MTDGLQRVGNRFKIRAVRFTLRTLFILTTFTAVGMALQSRANRQRVAVAALAELQVIVHYSHEPDWKQLENVSDFWTTAFQHKDQPNPNVPQWLQQSAGDDFFQTADGVCFPAIDTELIVTVLPHLKALPNLKTVVLSSGSCHDQSAAYDDAKQLLERELPNVEVMGYGAGIRVHDLKLPFGLTL